MVLPLLLLLHCRYTRGCQRAAPEFVHRAAPHYRCCCLSSGKRRRYPSVAVGV